MKEVWKDVQNFKGVYQISNTGRVKSLDRYVRNGVGKRFIKGGIKKPWLDKEGYVVYQLSKDSKSFNVKIHRLVAMAFLDNPSGLPQINHKDGCKTNNNVCNLEWCTNKYNQQHARENKLIDAHGEKCVTSKLKDSDVIKIRELYKTGLYSQREVGELFSITQSNVSHICRHSTWNHV